MLHVLTLVRIKRGTRRNSPAFRVAAGGTSSRRDIRELYAIVNEIVRFDRDPCVKRAATYSQDQIERMRRLSQCDERYFIGRVDTQLSNASSSGLYRRRYTASGISVISSNSEDWATDGR